MGLEELRVKMAVQRRKEECARSLYNKIPELGEVSSVEPKSEQVKQIAVESESSVMLERSSGGS